jgi:hypothetical protein
LRRKKLSFTSTWRAKGEHTVPVVISAHCFEVEDLVIECAYARVQDLGGNGPLGAQGVNDGAPLAKV